MENAEAKEFPQIERHFGVCPHCRYVLPPLESTASKYFVEGTVECPDCRQRLDLFECVRSQIKDDFPPDWGLQSLGARLSIFPIEVLPNGVVPIDLTQQEIPDDAVILSSHFQSDDGRALLFPIEFPLKPKRSDLTVYCMPVENKPMEPGKGCAVVCWIESGADAQSSIRIANAFRDIAKHDFASAMVEAFSGFEIALYTLITSHLDKHCSSQTLKRNLERRLTAAVMMQEFLPGLCEQLGVKPLNKSVSDALRRLRECRNRLLHRGSTEVITPSIVGEFLAATLIGIAFVRHIEGIAG
jgi:hypothetical protein